MATSAKTDGSQKSALQKIHKTEGSMVWSYLVYPALCLALLSILIMLLPLVLTVSASMRIFKYYNKRKIVEQYGKKVLIAASGDAIWFQESRDNMIIINAILFLKGVCSLDKFRQVINDRMVSAKDPDDPSMPYFPKATKYRSIISHRYVWVEEARFDIADHVYLHDQIMPEDEAELKVMLGKLASQPFPPEMSPWQFIVIPPNDSRPDDFGVFFRVHHSIADGVSLVKVLMFQMIDTPVQDQTHLTPHARFGSRQVISKFIKAVLEGPYMLVKDFVFPKDQHALHGPYPVGDKVVSWSERIPLDRIKKMKNAAGCTVNDILMACLAGSFRHYLQRHSTKLPSYILVYVPVDVRSSRSRKLVMDNQFSLVYLRLPVDEEDPLVLLDKVKSRMDVIKASPEPMVNYFVISFMLSRFPNWFTKMALDLLSRKCTMVLTNVPGPQEMLRFADCDMNDMVFWPPGRTNTALGVSIFSYNGHVRAGVYVDKILMSNADSLMEAFVHNVDVLASELKVD